MTRAFYKKKSGYDPTMVYNPIYLSHTNSEVLFQADDVIPFMNTVLDNTVSYIILTKNINSFSFKAHGLVWGELLHQYNSSGLSFTRYDDQREITVNKDSLLVDQEGSFICISSQDRIDTNDGLINLSEDDIVKIEFSSFQHRE